MDMNDIVTLCGTILIPIVVTILSWILNNKNPSKSLGKEWKCYYIRSSTDKFIIFFLWTISMIFVAPIIGGLFFWILKIFNDNNDSILYGGIFIYLIFGVGINILNNKNRLFTCKSGNTMVGTILLNCTIISSFSIYILICIKLEEYMWIPYILVIICQIISAFVLEKEVKYQYKKATIILEGGDSITDVDSDSIYIKDKWLIATYDVNSKKKEVRVSQDKVYRIEYFDKQF